MPLHASLATFASASASVPALRRLLASPTRGIVRSLLPDVAPPNVNYVSELLHSAHRYPNRRAIVDGRSGAALTYAQLRQATLAVASGLVRHSSFGRGRVLALFTDNRPEFVLALHGAVAAGGIASPINCHYTPAELAYPLRDAGASVAVTDRRRLPTLLEAARDAPELRDVYLIGETAASSRELGCRAFDELLADDGGAVGDAPVAVDADSNVAFLPYSSGTTGLPKGVMLSHNNVGVNLRQAQTTLRNPEAKETTVAVLPFYHIFALNTVVGNTLHTGGTIVTIPKFEPEEYLRLIDEHEATTLHVVPPLVLFLIQSPLVQQFQLSTLERVMSGAAPLGEDTEVQVRRTLCPLNPRLQFFQGYGLTETAPFSFANVCHDLESGAHRNHKPGSIGCTVASQDCKVVDHESRRELGPEETGEVAIRGPNIMKGYWNASEATAACIDDEGWFYTGDVGRYNADGYFYISDRVKELIKYKGLQVAPAELESVLLSHPKIKDCAVIGKPDDRAGEVPLAFIVPEGEDLDDKQVHDHMASLLSDHKQLRGGIRFVSSIPKSPSGKLLRRELRERL